MMIFKKFEIISYPSMCLSIAPGTVTPLSKRILRIIDGYILTLQLVYGHGTIIELDPFRKAAPI